MSTEQRLREAADLIRKHPEAGGALAAWLVFEADLLARAPHTEVGPRSERAVAVADAILGTPAAVPDAE